MLVLRRNDGEWVRVVHRSGDEMSVRVYAIAGGRCRLAFDDPARNFQIERPERAQPAPATEPTE